MRANRRRGSLMLLGYLGIAWMAMPIKTRAQNAPPATQTGQTEDVRALAEMVRQLQSRVEELSGKVASLEANDRVAKEEVQDLRAKLEKSQSGLGSASPTINGAPDVEAANASAMNSVVSGKQDDATLETKIAGMEEEIQLANSKINEQSQTKVESGAKYRLRLNGLMLFNTFVNRGTVDSQDVPGIAVERGLLGSPGTFGGSLRQTQIGFQAFGPNVLGARTSAEVKFDFAGGFPDTPNGVTMGIARLRTGTVHFDWANTSVVAGQDGLFFSPMAPTSFASVATPALAYSGNLWGWTPQIRIEHHFRTSESSEILVQGGILETLTGDMPGVDYARQSTWGEDSGQPAYAARISWSHAAFGQNITAGIGGYHGKQGWGFGRSVDGWVGTADLNVPVGRFVEVSGQFYRGKAVGGFGGGIGQNVLWNGSLANPDTEVYGLNSMGGWVQLKVKPTLKFEVNGAVGDDSPFASELRQFSGNPIYDGTLFSKNLSWFSNVIYRPRSDIVLSLEYKRLKTFVLDSNANSANHINIAVGYIF